MRNGMPDSPRNQSRRARPNRAQARPCPRWPDAHGRANGQVVRAWDSRARPKTTTVGPREINMLENAMLMLLFRRKADGLECRSFEIRSISPGSTSRTYSASIKSKRTSLRSRQPRRRPGVRGRAGGSRADRARRKFHLASKSRANRRLRPGPARRRSRRTGCQPCCARSR